MPPSFYCKPRCLKAGGRLTENSLAAPTKVAFMKNKSKKALILTALRQSARLAVFYIDDG